MSSTAHERIAHLEAELKRVMTVHERLAQLEGELKRVIKLADAIVTSLILVNDRATILRARIDDLENKIDDRSYTNDQHTNDHDEAESRRLARELLAEARAFGKPN